MSVGFGFSVGDFISALSLVSTVIDSVRSSSSSSLEYRELISQLFSLKTALLQVERLQFEEGQYAEVIALRQAASQCQRTIDSFWSKAVKYQPSLTKSSSSKSTIRDNWMKIKWALFKAEDLERFKVDMMGHTQSIQLLLATVQLGNASIHDQKDGIRERSLAGKIQEGYFNCMQRLSFVADQGKTILEVASNILRTNVKIFQAVLQIQQFIANIPSQVERQQPVYMIDALGKHSPFHLEFVRSAEALRAVLKINFQNHQDGAKKIEKGYFALQESGTKKDIDLAMPWDSCFFPGQWVDMSILFDAFQDGSGISSNEKDCPRCGSYSDNHNEEDKSDTTCMKCGLTFQKVVRQAVLDSTWSRAFVEKMVMTFANSRKRKREEQDFGSYRRIRLLEWRSFPADMLSQEENKAQIKKSIQRVNDLAAGMAWIEGS